MSFRDLRPLGLPPLDLVRALLDYDPETGIFTWRPRPETSPIWRSVNSRMAGKPCTGIGKYEYVRIMINQKSYAAHRLAWLHFHGKHPADQIDHINGNPTDNRIANLRESNQAQNTWNRARLKGRTLPKGVCHSDPHGKFCARIRVGGKLILLGTFPSAELAAAAYLAAAQTHFGEFARAG